MKRIKDLTVTVTYTVSLSDVEVNEKVFDALNALADRGCLHCNLVDKQGCPVCKGSGRLDAVVTIEWKAGDR